MNNHDTNMRSRTDASLTARLRAAKSRWHRSFADYALSFLSVFVGIGVFAMVLHVRSDDVSANAQSSFKNTVEAVAADPTPISAGSMCLQERDRQPTGRILLLAAQNQGSEFAPPLVALRETLASYFGFSVQVENAEDYTPDLLPGLTGLVIVGNAEFTDPDAVNAALDDAQSRALPVAWIGLHGADYSDALGLTFGPAIAGLQAGTTPAKLIYNDVALPLANQPFSPRFPVELAISDRILGHAHLEGGTAHANIVVDGRRAYVGFLPFDRFEGELSLAATVDAVSYVFGRRSRNPRVLLRLEDINGLNYAPGDQTFSRTTDFLMANDVFMHLAVIPQAVNEDQSLADEQVLADIGAAPSVVRLVKQHPDAVTIIQHGFRHSRRDPRNSGCIGAGCAYEFFLDDDETMGPEAAAAFARERLVAGRAVVERHLGPVFAFEAPHYALSPAQAEVAEELYQVLLHPLTLHTGTQTAFFLPWVTHRGTTAYGPSSVGYVSNEDPESIDKIINRLSDAAKVLPDPVVVVFYHPFLNNSPEGSEELKTLIDRVRQAGYRFANICDELATR